MKLPVKSWMKLNITFVRVCSFKSGIGLGPDVWKCVR